MRAGHEGTRANRRALPAPRSRSAAASPPAAIGRVVQKYAEKRSREDSRSVRLGPKNSIWLPTSGISYRTSRLKTSRPMAAFRSPTSMRFAAAGSRVDSFALFGSRVEIAVGRHGRQPSTRPVAGLRMLLLLSQNARHGCPSGLPWPSIAQDRAEQTCPSQLMAFCG